MREFVRELRQCLRLLRAAPRYSLVAVLTLALGIGASTAIFSVIRAAFLRPLPYPHSDRLVNLWEDERGVEPRWTVTPANYLDWRSASRSFEDMAAFNVWHPVLSGDDQPERVLASLVTPNFFRVIGVSPALGSDFAPGSGAAGGERLAMLSHELWQRRYGGDGSVLGRTILIGEQPHTVVGVMPPGYRHPDPSYHEGTQLWRAIAFGEDADRSSRFLRVLGRLRPGVTVEQARQEMAGIARALEEAHPATNAGWGVTLVPLGEQLFGDARAGLLLAMAAAVMMLLILCTNVATLALARSLGRTREFALRASLGAGRARLVRGVMLESALLSAGGAALGVALVALGRNAIAALQGRYVSPIVEVGVDFLVIGFAVLLALLTSVLFGLPAALRAGRVELRALIGDAGRAGPGRGSRRARGVLIAGEVALTTALVMCAVLLLRSFAGLLRVDPGFRPDHVLAFEMTAPVTRYATPEQRLLLFDRLREQLLAVPGVQRATFVSDLPFTGENRFMRYHAEGAPPLAGEPPMVEYHSVGPDYFGTAGLPLVAGREFGPDAEAAEAPEVIINQPLADELWPAGDAVGRVLLLGSEPDAFRARVVGVAAASLDDGLDDAAESRLFLSQRLSPPAATAVLLRTRAGPLAIVPSVRRAVLSVENDIAISDVTTLRALISETLALRRAVLTMIGIFAALALLAAGVGLYGVLAYMVGERRREIGIRTALGASPGEVRRLVVSDSLRMVGAGLLLGVPLALMAGRFLGTLLFGVGPHDLASLILVAGILAATAVLASLVPVQRALSVDPVAVLRHD